MAEQTPAENKSETKAESTDPAVSAPAESAAQAAPAAPAAPQEPAPPETVASAEPPPVAPTETPAAAAAAAPANPAAEPINEAAAQALLDSIEAANPAAAAQSVPAAGASPAPAAPSAEAASSSSPASSPATAASAADSLAANSAEVDELLKQASFEDPSPAGNVPPAPEAEPFNLPAFQQAMNDAQVSSIELLRDVELNVKIELGRNRMLVEDVLKLSEGSVVELDKLAGDPVDVFVNDRLVARGEVLVLNDNFCVRVNEIVAGATEEGL
jgi:flagellar motor switch protein FliN